VAINGINIFMAVGYWVIYILWFYSISWQSETKKHHSIFQWTDGYFIYF